MSYIILSERDTTLFTLLVTKHTQISHIKIIYDFAFEGVYYQFLNIISTFLKSVTTHGRDF